MTGIISGILAIVLTAKLYVATCITLSQQEFPSVVEIEKVMQWLVFIQRKCAFFRYEMFKLDGVEFKQLPLNVYPMTGKLIGKLIVGNV